MTDVIEFIRLSKLAADTQDEVSRARTIDQALALYGAGLLPGYSYSWTVGEREKLEFIHRRLVSLLIETSSKSPEAAALIGALPSTAWESIESERVEEVPASPTISSGSQIMAESFSLLKGDRMRVLAFVLEAEPYLTGPDADRWMRRLDHEYPLIQTVLAEAMQHDDYTTAIRIASQLWRYWIDRNESSVGRQLFDRLFLHVQRAEDDYYAQALIAAGMLDFFGGFPDRATSRLQHALNIWTKLQNIERTVQVRSNLAMIASQSGMHEEAGEILSQSLTVARYIGDEHGVMARLLNAAQARLHLRDAASARNLLDERMALAMSQGLQTELAQTQAYMASVELLEDNVYEATEFARSANEFFIASGDLRWASFTHRLLGRAAQNLTAYDDALFHFQESVRLASESRDPREIAESLSYLGEAYELVGDVGAAKTCKAQAADLRASISLNIASANDEGRLSGNRK